MSRGLLISQDEVDFEAPPTVPGLEERETFLGEGRPLQIRETSQGIEIVVDGPIPDWIGELGASLAEILRVPQDPTRRAWRLDRTLVASVLRFLGDVLDVDSKAPGAAPTERGGIRLEWRTGEGNVRLEFSTDGTEVHYVDPQTHEERRCELRAVSRSQLIPLIRRASDPHAARERVALRFHNRRAVTLRIQDDSRVESVAPAGAIDAGAAPGVTLRVERDALSLVPTAPERVAGGIVILRLANATGQRLRVWLEPWGDFVEVDEGSAVKVVSDDIEPIPLGVELHEGRVTLWWEWGRSGPELVSGANESLLDYRRRCP